MSARTRLPAHLVPARRRARPLSVHGQGHMESLEALLNRTVLTVQRATHEDILKLGDRFVSNEEPLPVIADPSGGVDVDGILLDAQAKFDRELRSARDVLRRELMAEKEKALAEQKEEFERHLDQVCSLRDKAEDMAKRDLRRACDLEKQAALRQLRDTMETRHRDDVERARVEERQLARQTAAADRTEAVQRALEQAEAEFTRREQQTIERTRQDCRRQFNEELTGIRKRHREEVDSWMTKYKNLYKNFEQLLDTNRDVAGDFRSIQADYKRFLDYSDGHFHSDYMMKLKHVSLDAASEAGRSVADLPLPASTKSPVPVISLDCRFPSAGPAPNRQRVEQRRQRPLPPPPPRPEVKNAEVYTDEDVF